MHTNENTAESLLNIKQAAKILNASVVSLRRWTDAGKLPCLRIGTRRERRFRLSDLNAYLEQNRFLENPLPSDPAPGQTAHITLEGISINYGTLMRFL
ncbi:helix-turn-helix domain-containing protein [Nitrosomonas marina]|uniref:helix-turn-helix domain-containing protein n=1 Tax=Nitrosomonas marina TaxID=917 RepID=UPI000B80F005|nr:helix-turn-helix domain-containing protein [Nitrosomonas marina]